MNHLAIIKRLPEDYVPLYQLSRRKKLTYELRECLEPRVRDIRREFQVKARDPLAEKAERYGNIGRWAVIKSRELSRLIYENKRPDGTDIGQWLSVEIECVLPSESAERAFAKFCRSGGYGKFITIKNDGSIRTPENECQGCESSENDDDCECEGAWIGKEIVVTLKYGDWKILQDVCASLSDLGAVVNKSCGLHVHFDCRNLSAAQVTTMGKRVARCVPALKQMLPKSRQKNSYCIDTINKHRGGSRYSFVNLHSFRKHSTLEIRGHSGTVDSTKITNWIRLLRAVMNTRNTKELSTAPDLIRVFKIEPDLSLYVLERFQKFSKATDSEDDVADDQVA